MAHDAQVFGVCGWHKVPQHQGKHLWGVGGLALKHLSRRQRSAKNGVAQVGVIHAHEAVGQQGDDHHDAFANH